jgi:mannose-1-phosphate guanylyltransferase
VQALILAGGEGTRLRPLTLTVPKPVLPLANRPFSSYMIEWLSAHGVLDVVMSCGFLASEVRNVLGDGERWGVRLRYATEDEALGTAGAVKFAEDLLDDRFLVLNGDILADFDLTALLRFHDEREALVTIALVAVDDPSAFGLVRSDSAGRISGFLEKPAPDEIDTNLINAGAYVLERSVLDRVPEERAVSFEREVFPGLVGAGLYGFRAEGYWLDIGTPERYLEATFDILDGKVRTTLDEELADSRASIAPTALVAGVEIVAPAIIGEDCEVEPGARVGSYAVLGEGCRIASGAVVERSALWSGVALERESVVRGGIVAADARIGEQSRVEPGAVVGEGAALAPRTVLAEGDRVDPK